MYLPFGLVTFAQHCQRCSNAGYFDNLVAGIVSHRSNFVAARLNGTENRPQKLGNPGNVGYGNTEKFGAADSGSRKINS